MLREFERNLDLKHLRCGRLAWCRGVVAVGKECYMPPSQLPERKKIKCDKMLKVHENS